MDSLDESSFAHLVNLQVLDFGAGNTELSFKREEVEVDNVTEKEQEIENTPSNRR